MDRYDELRASERAIYELNDGGYKTRIAYDQKSESVQNALFSIYTTSFIIVLLVVSNQISWTMSGDAYGRALVLTPFCLVFLVNCRVERTSSLQTSTSW
jgi:hypothetical protein